MQEKVPFISAYGTVLRDVDLPLPAKIVWDVPVPTSIMDPYATRPGSKWSVETTFRLQTVNGKDHAYVAQGLLNRYKRKIKL